MFEYITLSDQNLSAVSKLAVYVFLIFMVDVCLCVVGFMNQRYMLVTRALLWTSRYVGAHVQLPPLSPQVLLLTAFTEATSHINVRNTGAASIVEDV